MALECNVKTWGLFLNTKMNKAILFVNITRRALQSLTSQPLYLCCCITVVTIVALLLMRPQWYIKTTTGFSPPSTLGSVSLSFYRDLLCLLAFFKPYPSHFLLKTRVFFKKETIQIFLEQQALPPPNCFKGSVWGISKVFS